MPFCFPLPLGEFFKNSRFLTVSHHAIEQPLQRLLISVPGFHRSTDCANDLRCMGYRCQLLGNGFTCCNSTREQLQPGSATRFHDPTQEMTVWAPVKPYPLRWVRIRLLLAGVGWLRGVGNVRFCDAIFSRQRTGLPAPNLSGYLLRTCTPLRVLGITRCDHVGSHMYSPEDARAFAVVTPPRHEPSEGYQLFFDRRRKRHS